MNEKKPASPLVIVVMIVAIIAIGGFSIMQFMGSNAQLAPVTPGIASSGTAQNGPAVAQAPPAAGPKPVISVEAAKNTNPFAPLPMVASKGSLTPSAANSALPSAPPGVSSANNGPVPAPLLVSRDRRDRAAALNASVRSEGTLPSVGGVGPSPMPVAIEPKLAGTMLGSRPTAVFEAEGGSVMVPQGGAYLGWRIMRVSHGEVTVWNGDTTLHLKVGMPSSPASRTASNLDDPTPYAQANVITVHYSARPTASRQELVYGRIEETSYDGPEGLDQDIPEREPEKEPDAAPIGPGPAKPLDENLGEPRK